MVASGDIYVFSAQETRKARKWSDLRKICISPPNNDLGKGHTAIHTNKYFMNKQTILEHWEKKLL